MAEQATQPNTNAAEAALPPVPSEWPGAFGLYKYSKAVVKVNLWTIVIIWVVTVAVGLILEWKVGIIGQIVSSLISVLGTAAYILAYLAGVRREKLSVGEALTKAFPFWLRAIGLGILTSLAIFVSILALIIPFFFVFPRVYLATYFLIGKNLGVVESFKASWNATEGHSLKIWATVGANVAMALIALTIIGIPFAIYFLIMYSAAPAVMYVMFSQAQPAAAPAAPAPVESAPAA